MKTSITTGEFSRRSSHNYQARHHRGDFEELVSLSMDVRIGDEGLRRFCEKYGSSVI